MEFILVSAVAGLGFLLSKNNNPRQTKVGYLAKVSKNSKPSGVNIYENRRSQEVWDEQQSRANEVFPKSRNALKTNYMIAGPPVPIFNKIDGTDNTLPVEFIGANGLKQKVEAIDGELGKKVYKNEIERPLNDMQSPTLFKDYAGAGGWEGISLTGNPVDRQSFFHNNMTPFFGGTAKQNVEDTANQTLLETFTGNDSNYQSKVELKRDDLFQPVANLTNVYGVQNLDGYNLDRYVVGNIRNNQSPVEPIRVGPGLNQGFTAEGSGGFQQANTLDFVLPKTVDELRVKTKPKVSYEGVVIPGSGVSKPGKVGTVAKNQPDRFYVNSPDRLFTTVGATTGPAQRPAIDVKFTNRKTTELKTRIGSAAPAATGSQPQLKPKFRNSSRINHGGSGPRNQNAQGQWGIMGPNDAVPSGLPNDYGRASFKTRPNMRAISGPKMQVTNLSAPNKSNRAPQNPNIKHTRKNNVVGNNRWAGNFQNTGPNKTRVYDPNDVPRATIKEQNVDNTHQGYFQNTGPNKGTVYDPNDVLRTTIKEQNVDNTHQGYFQNTGPNKGTVYDPNDVLRNTIKEQNIDNSHVGYFQNTGPNKGTVYDPNDVFRTTIKEQNIDNSHQGYFQNTGPNKATTYDPNDVLRTTIKEQNIDNNHQGYFQNTGPNKATTYDPNDVLRTTIKEQNIDNSHIGYFQNTGPNKALVYNPNDKPRYTIKHDTMVRDNVGNIQNQTAGGGYKNIKMKAKETNRITTSVHYVGDAKGESHGGYKNANVRAKNTERQFHTGEVKGNAGPATVKAQTSYDDSYNMSVKTIREQVAVGRKPAHSGPKRIYSKDDINMKTTRTGDLDNARIENRGVSSTKVYNSMPQKNQFGETHYKDTLPNEPLADRINPEILDAFRANPYTQSLHSFVFQ